MRFCYALRPDRNKKNTATRVYICGSTDIHTRKNSKPHETNFNLATQGSGFIFHLLLAIPVVGIMLDLPLSTIAATTETIKKLKLNKTD